MPEKVLYQFCGAGDMRGGVQDSTNTIGRFMAEQGVEPHVFVGTMDNPQKTVQNFDGFEPHNIHVLGGSNHYAEANGSQNPLGAVINPFRPYLSLRALQPDILHINAPWMPHIGGAVLRMAQHRDIPTLATYHIVSDKLGTNAALIASGRFDAGPIQRLDAMVAVSEPARRHMEKTYKYKGEVHIVPNGVDIERYEQAKPFESDEPFVGFDSERPTVVFVGRPDPRKGLAELTSAMQLVQREIPEAQLIVCGGDDDSLHEYKARAAWLGTEVFTHYMGQVSEEDKARWFAGADIAALPATGNESQGIVLLEAMAAGAGVVLGGNNEGYASVFNADDVAFDSDLMLVDPMNTTAFANQMITILNCPELATDLHVEQQKLVRRKYDIQHVGRQLLDIYRSIL